MDATVKEKIFRVLLLAIMPLLFFGCGGGVNAGAKLLMSSDGGQTP